MSKTFTLHEAQTLLPVLESLLKRAKGTAEKAAGLEDEMQGLAQRIFLSGGMRVDVGAAAKRRAQFDKWTTEVADTLEEIDAIGVQVKNLELGVLAFPYKLDRETVFLTWELGEDAITTWLRENEELSERKPVDGRFGRIERERPN